MYDNDQVQGSMHNGRWVSRDEKISRGFNNTDQIYGNSHKMNAHFGYGEAPAPFTSVPWVAGAGPTSIKYVLIGLAVMIGGSCLALYAMFGEKAPTVRASTLANNATEAAAARSDYVKNISLDSKLTKLGTARDGSIKSRAEIAKDYQNVLKGVLPQSEINSLVSTINANYGQDFYLKNAQELRWKAERYKKEDLFDKQISQYFLNNLLYDPTKPELRYDFTYNPIKGTTCDINNVCVTGPRYQNAYYNEWAANRNKKSN